MQPTQIGMPRDAEMPAELPCHRCGYDLRAHPPDGKCPECEASVAESRRLAAVPRRPAWRDSDPRWRRRVLAGAWVLVFLPLMDALDLFDWSSRVPVPVLFDYRGVVHTLDDTLASSPGVYAPLAFCVGMALLFSKERGRRRSRMDWTRRWGVLCSYVVLFLSAVQVLSIAALVLAGISALFISIPPKYQPPATQWFINLSTAYLRHGPYPKDISFIVLVAFSSITVGQACIPLYTALRSSGPKWLAALLVFPLVLFALMHLERAARLGLEGTGVTGADVYPFTVYFSPRLPLSTLAGSPPIRWIWPSPGDLPAGSLTIEAAKWCIVLAIALWLSIAQLMAWRQRRRARAA
jgi:hypothetical protein